jgi:hypothetical protein
VSKGAVLLYVRGPGYADVGSAFGMHKINASNVQRQTEKLPYS